MKTNKSSLTGDMHVKCLARAPGIIFLLVASANGNIDNKQVQRFIKLMATKDYLMLASMLEQAGMTISELLNEVLTNNLDPSQELLSICHVVDIYQSEEAALAYKVKLFKLANNIAITFGGIFGFFSHKISADEQAAIAFVASLLGLHDDTDDESATNLQAEFKDSVKPKYSSVSNLPNTLFPALLSADWVEKTDTDIVSKRIHKFNHLTSREPMIAYALETPESVAFLTLSCTTNSLSVEKIHDKAVQNLENRLDGQIEWKALNVDIGVNNPGTASGLVLTGDYYCSEALLSQKLLCLAHQKLETNFLMAIAPVQGELYVTKLISEQQPEPDRLIFAHFAISRYFSPQQAQISPNVWIIRNGTVAGYISGMDQIIEDAKQNAIQSMSENHERLNHTV
jgi:hypothetical protein